jgi:hypothetical protein
MKSGTAPVFSEPCSLYTILAAGEENRGPFSRAFRLAICTYVMSRQVLVLMPILARRHPHAPPEDPRKEILVTKARRPTDIGD